MDGKIISVINQKGGAGKTTTAAALGAGLVATGEKVLLIDLDTGNLSRDLSGQQSGAALEVLKTSEILPEHIQRTPYGDLIAADEMTATAEAELIQPGAEMHLREALEPFRSEYDYMIIDTPPTLGRRVTNALTASDYVIIPTEATPHDLSGTGQLFEIIRAVQRYTNKNLHVLGILITNYEGRGKLQQGFRETAEAMAEAMKTDLFQIPIPHGTDIQKAQARQISIFEQAPNSKPAKAYADLIREVKRRITERR